MKTTPCKRIARVHEFKIKPQQQKKSYQKPIKAQVNTEREHKNQDFTETVNQETIHRQLIIMKMKITGKRAGSIIKKDG